MANIVENVSMGILAFIGGVGWQEILIIVFVLLLLFGGKKLPELARGMGRGLRHFKEELHGVKKQISDSAAEVDVEVPDEPEPEPEPAPEPKSDPEPAEPAEEPEPAKAVEETK